MAKLLDADQQTCLTAVMNSHNLVILGQAGTGKAFSVKECVKSLKASGKTVSLNLALLIMTNGFLNAMLGESLLC